MRFCVVVWVALLVVEGAACSKHSAGPTGPSSDSIVIQSSADSAQIGSILTITPTLRDGASATLMCNATLGLLGKTSDIPSGSRVAYFSRNVGTENIACSSGNITGNKTIQITPQPTDSGYLPLSTPLRFVYDDDGTPAPLTVTISLVTPSFGSQVVGGFFGLPDGGTGTYCIDHPGNCWGMKGEFRWDDGVQNPNFPGLWLSDTPGQYQVGAVSPGSTVLSQVQPFDTLPMPGHFTTFGPGQALKYLEGKAELHFWSDTTGLQVRQIHLPPQETGWHF